VIDTNNDGILDSFFVNFGKVTNNVTRVETAPNPLINQISISVIGIITNSASNINMNTITSSTVCTYFNSFNYYNITSSTAVTIVEPFLTMSKTLSEFAYSFIEAGNVASYTLTITHTGAFKSATFNINVTDLLSSELALVPGSVTTCTGTVATGVTNTTVLVYPATYLTIMNPLLVITYSATITYLAPVSSLVWNTVNLDWSSAPTSTSPLSSLLSPLSSLVFPGLT
jgi:large repetitive protein